MAAEDQLASLIERNSALFTTYEQWANAQVMLFAGKIDDPESFNAEGGKTGALGYYPVINVSGQTMYVPSLARLQVIAASSSDLGAVEAILSETVTARDSALAASSEAVATVASKAGKLELKSAMTAPLRLAMQGGVYPIIVGGRRLPLAMDRFGRVIGSLIAPSELPAVITNGVMPLARDRDGKSLVWLDMRRRRLRSVGDDLDREDSIPSPFAVLAGRHAIQTVGVEGQVYNPSSATAPIAYDASVTDPGGTAVRQVFMCDGARVQRLTASQVDCFNPQVIAPGVVRYARADGRIGIARAARGELMASATLKMHCLHGQSLAGGSSSFAPGTQPNLRQPPESRVRMFNGGVRAAFGTGAYNAANFTSFVDAKEALGTDNLLSDTGMTAFGFALTRDQGGEVLVTSTGVGGAAYDVIGPGTQPWANMVYGMGRAAAIAGTAVIESLHWRHGESQEDDDAAAYATKINGAHSQFITDAQAATGQATIPVMLLQQINRMEASGRPAGPLAYRLDGPGWAVANIATGADTTKLTIGPQYPSEFGDQYHMTPNGYDFMATHAAKAFLRNKLRRWQPLHAKSALRMGRIVELTFGGGWLDWGGALTLDTSLVSDPGAFGFSWYDTAGIITVQNVQVVSRTMVRLVLSAVPVTAGGVGIAFFAASELDVQGPTTGLRSCLRDNDPAGCPVTGRPLHNYAISQIIGATTP